MNWEFEHAKTLALLEQARPIVAWALRSMFDPDEDYYCLECGGLGAIYLDIKHDDDCLVGERRQLLKLLDANLRQFISQTDTN